MSAAAYRAPQVDELGRAIATHSQGKTLASRVAITLFICAPAVYFAVRSSMDGAPLFPSDSIPLVQAAYAFVYFVLPLLAVVVIVKLVRHRHDRVEVHENGLIVHVMGKEDRVPFGAIHSIRSAVTRGRNGVSHLHTVKWEGGEVLLTEAFDRIDALMTALRVKTAEGLARRSVERIDGGREASFGPFAVDATSLRHGKRRVELRDVGDVDVSGGRVAVRRCDGATWETVDASEVENLHVFVPFVQVRADRARAANTR